MKKAAETTNTFLELTLILDVTAGGEKMGDARFAVGQIPLKTSESSHLRGLFKRLWHATDSELEKYLTTPGRSR